MASFNVPTRDEVSSNNQEIFDTLNKAVGFVPNLYATMAYSDNALGNYLQFQNSKTSLSKKEKEIISLVVSQVNDCKYCQSAHTAIAKMNGFTEQQVLELRQGYYSDDSKYDALVKLAKSITKNKGKVEDEVVDSFFEVGYNKENLIDVFVAIGDKIIMNYIHNLTQIEIDFPIAKELERV